MNILEPLKSMSNESKTLYIIYDGECPFCAKCAKALRIKKVISNVTLLNARSDPYQHLLNNQSFDLNEGMLVILDGEYYYGPKAAQILALISTPSDAFNKMNYLLFHKLFFARIFYPLFKLLRYISLKSKGSWWNK